MPKQNFLREVYKKNKMLFFAFAFFIFANITTNYFGFEAPPIYNFTMYSGKSVPTKYETFFVVEYDVTPFNLPEIWDHHRRIWLMYSLEFYWRTLHQKNKTHDVITQDYPQWLKRYLSSLLKKDIKHLKIYRIEGNYLPNGKIDELSKTLVCES